MRLTVFGFGMLVFFDGLAVMLIGRLLRGAADRWSLSGKAGLLADATGSAVACLALFRLGLPFNCR